MRGSAMTPHHATAKRKAKRRVGPISIFGTVVALSFGAFGYADGLLVRAHDRALLTTGSIAATDQSKPRPALSELQAKYIVRSTMKSLHDALLTGNFTVFRDLAGPSMRARYSAAQLFEKFEYLVANRVNLGATISAEPALTHAAGVQSSDAVRLDGSVMSGATPIGFSMIVEPDNNRWAVADLGFDTPQAQADAAATNRVGQRGQVPNAR